MFYHLCKKKIEKISELTSNEIIELKDVMKEIEIALMNISKFKPDRFNYFQMGNSLHHLHFHGIPRYATSRNFNGQIWIDETWGAPPTWSKTNVNKKLVLEIKNTLLPHLFLRNT